LNFRSSSVRPPASSRVLSFCSVCTVSSFTLFRQLLSPPHAGRTARGHVVRPRPAGSSHFSGLLHGLLHGLVSSPAARLVQLLSSPTITSQPQTRPAAVAAGTRSSPATRFGLRGSPSHKENSSFPTRVSGSRATTESGIRVARLDTSPPASLPGSTFRLSSHSRRLPLAPAQEST